jgi:hypothetical protein
MAVADHAGKEAKQNPGDAPSGFVGRPDKIYSRFPFIGHEPLKDDVLVARIKV